MTTTTLPSPAPLVIWNDMFKAHILDYDADTDDDYQSGDDDRDFEDDDDYWADLEEDYERKEDEDVAVFMAIVDHLPIESLLHLLQGHVRANPIIQQHPSNDQQEIQETKEEHEEDMSHNQYHPRPPKQFRWAECSENVVRQDVYEIEAIKDMRQLWFSAPELHAIRQDLIRQIRFFLRHHQERIEVLDRVIVGEDPEATMEEHMKSLTKHSIGRGLEGHMSRLIPQTRKQHVWGVLNAQSNCNFRRKSYDETIEVLREQSLINGKHMLVYAQRMGKCDEIEALTASMSQWEEGTEATA